MNEEKKPEVLKEYAGGWMTERQGQPIPTFLKIAFPIIGLSSVSYLVIYMNGETTHSERGPLVQAFNRATTSADPLMYIVAALAFVFVVVAATYAVRKSDH